MFAPNDVANGCCKDCVQLRDGTLRCTACRSVFNTVAMGPDGICIACAGNIVSQGSVNCSSASPVVASEGDGSTLMPPGNALGRSEPGNPLRLSEPGNTNSFEPTAVQEPLPVQVDSYMRADDDECLSDSDDDDVELLADRSPPPHSKGIPAKGKKKTGKTPVKDGKNIVKKLDQWDQKHGSSAHADPWPDPEKYHAAAAASSAAAPRLRFPTAADVNAGQPSIALAPQQNVFQGTATSVASPPHTVVTSSGPPGPELAPQSTLHEARDVAVAGPPSHQVVMQPPSPTVEGHRPPADATPVASIPPPGPPDLAATLALLPQSSQDSARDNREHFCALKSQLDKNGAEFQSFKAQVEEDIKMIPSIVTAQITTQLQVLPEMVAEEVSKQMKAQGGQSSHAAASTVSPSLDPSSFERAVIQLPTAVEISNIVPYGDLKTSGASSAEIRTYGSLILGAMKAHARAFFDNAPENVVQLEARFQTHARFQLCAKHELTAPQMSLCIDEIKAFTAANHIRQGCEPRVSPGKGTAELKAEQDLKSVRLLVKAEFEHLDIQCRHRISRIVVVDGRSRKQTAIAGIGKDGKPFILPHQCVLFGMEQGKLKQLEQEMVEALR